MALRPCTDTSRFDWLRESSTEPGQLITWGPSGYDAYARLRLIPDPPSEDASEASVVLAEDHLTDLAQVRRAVFDLAPFTDSPNDCIYCVWDGYSDIDLGSFGLESRASLRIRSYVLLQGSVADFSDWERFLSTDAAWAPAFVWPADRRWCVTKDVDPHWAAIAGTTVAVRAVVDDRALDAITTDPLEPVPTYR